MKTHIGYLCVASLSLAATSLWSAEQPVDFAREVLPVLSDKCFICHGPNGQETEEGLRLDSFTAAIEDRDGRRAIDPIDPEKSELLLRINSTDDPMPPEDSDKQLTSSERLILSRWVREGGEYAQHWAFVPPIKRPPANRKLADDSMIDAFVLEELASRQQSFADEADRATLARRAALVLTGLPPDAKRLRSFLGDKSPGAYGRLVDDLLDSPRYGEHQARYWLDAVRYGDTHGLHLDNRRGIFPYRDWVVEAMNRNLRLDEFITWQIAGDLLPEPTLEQLVATGYVRMNPTTAEGGALPEEFQAKNNFDRVETLGTVFLGVSLTCARCHSHKYDPIPQTEYYRLLAFFNSTAERSMDGNKYEYGPVVKAPANVDAWGAWRALQSAQQQLLADADTHVAKAQKSDSAAVEQWRSGKEEVRLALLSDGDGLFKKTELQSRAGSINKRRAAAEKNFTATLVARDLPKPRETYFLRRGEYNLPMGKPLEPGIVTVMGAFPKDSPRNRLGLAKWLVAREHPLVARVLVNRIWQRSFGYGLVRTPEDFGLQGQQPTHPKLLDWLAVELHESGWDLKHMMRLIVTSKTFRQSSARRVEIDDPENRLFARGPSHRLDAEVIRDIALWASGLLDEQMGGEGVKPYQPKGLWSALMHPASNTKKYVQDSGAKLYRRSIYVYWKRTSPHPMMTLFDAPSRESSCVRRSRTNTSLQSLGLLNETQRIEMARVLAERLLREADNDSARVDLLYRLLASRKPNEGERAACMKLLRAMQSRYEQSKEDGLALLAIGDTPRDEKPDAAQLAAWSQLAIAVLASDAAISLY